MSLFVVIPVLAQPDPVAEGPIKAPVKAPVKQAPVHPGVTAVVWAQIAGLLKALRKGDMWGVLIALCNLIVALLKNSWVQAKLKVWGNCEKPWLTKRMKVGLAILVGVALVFFLAPANSLFRTLLKGLNVGLCSIGLYSVWKHFRPQEVVKKEG
jgi:hypothetical protein